MAAAALRERSRGGSVVLAPRVLAPRVPAVQPGGLCSAWGGRWGTVQGGGQVRHCLSARRAGVITQISKGCIPMPSPVCCLPRRGVSPARHPGGGWLCPCRFPASAPALHSGLRWCLFNHLLDKPGQTMKRSGELSSVCPLARCPPAFPWWHLQRNAPVL